MKKILATVSAMAILAMASIPAIAADKSVSPDSTVVHDNNPYNPETNTITEKDIQRGLENTKKNINEAAETASDAVKDAYESVKYTLLGPETSPGPVMIDSRVTADGMIGKPMKNANGDQVAVLHDLILDKNGNVKMVVVSDADFIKAGSKQAAFDYSLITRLEQDGDLITPLSEGNIAQARSFSYDVKDSGKADTLVIPVGGYSARHILDAEVVDSTGKKVADVDNFSVKNGKANMLIIGYDKVLGVGGEDAAIAFADVKLVRRDNDKVEFQLTAVQSDQFSAFKKSATN